jgi:uncharacterized protein (DUF3820 family)
MDDDSLMPWGKHKGKTMAQVPDEYLLWLYENVTVTGPVKRYVTDNIDAIKANVKRKKTRR